MPLEMCVRAVHEGDLRFRATAGDHEIAMEFPLRPGPTTGMKPLETLLASLAACSGNILALLLRRAERSFDRLEVTARGVLRDTHPRVFEAIDLEFAIRGAGIDAETVGRALEAAEEQLCPVWVMLKPGVRIVPSFRILDA